jgi:hypothetical protein
MYRNIGTVDRFIRIAAGVGVCPIYLAFGLCIRRATQAIEE